jgi:hypothetical protein
MWGGVLVSIFFSQIFSSFPGYKPQIFSGAPRRITPTIFFSQIFSSFPGYKPQNFSGAPRRITPKY